MDGLAHAMDGRLQSSGLQLERGKNIMHDKQTAAPDSTAVRVALWRAMHVQIDPPPHVLEDKIGLRLVAPEDDWRRRPDMDPHFASRFRASIVARPPLLEDTAPRQTHGGGRPIVILGARVAAFSRGPAATASRLLRFDGQPASPAD